MLYNLRRILIYLGSLPVWYKHIIPSSLQRISTPYYT